MGDYPLAARGLTDSIPLYMAKRLWPISPALLAVAALFLTACGGSLSEEISNTPSGNRTVAEKLLGTVDTEHWVPGTFYGNTARSHFSYVGLQGKQRVAVVDGVAGTPYSRLGIPHFSPDSKHAVFVAGILTSAGLKRYVQTPTPAPPAEPVPVRSDNWYLVADGQHSTPYWDIIGSPGFSPVVFDSRNSLHYIAIRGTSVYRAEETFRSG